MTSIDEDAVRARVAQHGGWSVKAARGDRPIRLCRVYRFSDFVQALAFVNHVGAIAESHEHHPHIELAWGHVSLELWSHDCHGVTERDFRFVGDLEEPSEV